MPFIVPKKRTSLSRSERFSRYRDVEVAPSGLLLLQCRKEPKRKSAKPLKGPHFRIITHAYPRYEVAYGAALEDFRANEWTYCVHELPKLMPADMSKDAIAKWCVACGRRRCACARAVLAGSSRTSRKSPWSAALTTATTWRR